MKKHVALNGSIFSEKVVFLSYVSNGLNGFCSSIIDQTCTPSGEVRYFSLTRGSMEGGVRMVKSERGQAWLGTKTYISRATPGYSASKL